MIRRDFIKQSSGLFLAASMPRLGLAQIFDSPPPIRRSGVSILQGATDETSTQISILDKIANQTEIKITSPTQEFLNFSVLKTLTFPGSDEKLVTISIQDLAPGIDYQLKVTNLKSGSAEVRSFRALNFAQSNLNFAICSCMDDTRHEPMIWTQLVSQNPDLMFFIGDAVYIDKNYKGIPDPAVIWRRHCEARRTLEIYYAKKLTPIFATWDDHDFGMDNSDSSYPFAKESLKMFKDFFPMDVGISTILSSGPGLSSALKIKDHLFLLLDDRTYRKPKGSMDRYAQWGAQQEQWMMDSIFAHHGPVWLLNGTQFFTANKIRDGVAGDHPVQFKGFIKNLQNTRNPLVFVSGDVHFSELSNIEAEVLGRQSFEITSSSIHSRSFLGAYGPNPRRMEAIAERNYVMVDTSLTSGNLDFALNCQSNSASFFQRRLRVSG